ncbi:MAG: Ig-like domain-containing protein [Candidatus Falkowbacteria bacterium]|nr:Ig-like domain-containing protein [Candidatus Falkowbacteria bacterium]
MLGQLVIRSDGSVLAAPIWHDFMLSSLGNGPVESFKAPEDVKTGKAILDGDIKTGQAILVDKISGLLATSSTPPELIETKNVFEHHCILFYVDKDNPLGPIPSNPSNDPQFNSWETAVINWAKRNNEYASSTSPTAYDNLHTPENQPNIKIISPKEGEIISEKTINILVETTSARGVKRVDYYLNNNLLGSSDQAPFNLSADISFVNDAYQNLKARACDDVENCTTAELNFNFLLKNNRHPEKTSLLINAPRSGLALNKIDFPLNIDFNTSGLEQIAKINFLVKKSDVSLPQIISSLRNINDKNNIIAWDLAPEPGDYVLYGELYDWSGEIKKSNEVNLTVK